MIQLKSESHNKDWQVLESQFDDWLTAWDPVKNYVSMKEYFGDRIGWETSKNMLHKNGVLKSKDDVQGVYVFLCSNHPFYVGISKKVVYRIQQHIKGTNHQTSSLAYRIGADHCCALTGVGHEGGRAGLDKIAYLKPAQQQLRNCNVSIFPVANSTDLYLFEVYTSMKLKTFFYNKFETH